MKIAKAKEQVKKARKKEEKELKFLIRDFYELKVLFKMIKDAEEEKSKGNHKEVESKIKKILRKLRGGITGSEERIERRMARSYTQMRDFIKDTEPYLAKVYPHEVEGINNLLRQAEMYNADLEKLGSRGGEIEDKLRAAKKDPSQLDAAFEDIKKALRDVQAFEEIINQLLHKTKEILSEFEKLKYQEDSSIEILDFEGDSHGDYETEYHMNFKITGTIGGKPFTVGKGDEDIYVTGAHKFDNIDELAEWIEEREHDATGVMAKYNEDEFEHVLKMILDKMKSEPKWRAKLEELREHCNDTADEMQDSWNSGW